MTETIDAEEACREAVAAGKVPDEIVSHLHSRGVSILGSIEAIRTVCSLPLGEAKRLVTGHSVWAAEVNANQSLHDAAEAAVGERGTSDFSPVVPKSWLESDGQGLP